MIRPADDEMQAWIDRRLDPERRMEIDAWLDGAPGDRRLVDELVAQGDALRALGAPVLVEHVPERLLAAATGRRRYHRAAQRWLLAAAVAGFGWALGWVSHAWFLSVEPVGSSGRRAIALTPGGSDGAITAAPAAPRFVRDAVVAHAVYVPEVRHPVEVGVDQDVHLVKWLSKRLGRPLRAPRLDAEGFSLMGGRLLPGEEGARAQFMYQNPSGQRLTLYLSQRPQDAHGETAFRYQEIDGISAFYWIDRSSAYTLSAALPRDSLLTLAQAVYRELEP